MAVTTTTTTQGSVKVTKSTGTATAQVSPAGSPKDAIHAAGTVPVSEVSVGMDSFVTDPSGSKAVQDTAKSVPANPLVLPIAGLDANVPFDTDDDGVVEPGE